MIRAIIFDCFGVLYQGSLQHLVDVCPASDRQQLRDYSRQFDYGMINYGQFVQEVSDLTLHSSDDIRRIMTASHIRNQELVDYTQKLKGEGYQIALLSNVGKGMMAGLFNDLEREKLFDVVVLSGELGMIKPDPLIYEHTAQRLGVAAEQCLMIDDSPNNIDGAEKSGMYGIVFTDTEQAINDVNSTLRVQLT